MGMEKGLNLLKKGYVRIHLGQRTYRVRLLTLVLFAAAIVVLVAAILILILANSCAPSANGGESPSVSPSLPAGSPSPSAGAVLPSQSPDVDPSAGPGTSSSPNTNVQSSSSPDSSSSPSPSNGADDFVTIELNANEPRVAEVQQKLINLYYMVYPATKDGKKTTTTLFGSITSQAVRIFQERNELTVTGKVDKATYDKLMSSDAKAYIMHQGDKCEMVKEIQAVLKEKGFLDSDPTGHCGEKTIAAVKAFQKSKGLTEDGNAGPGTLKALFGY